MMNDDDVRRRGQKDLFGIIFRSVRCDGNQSGPARVNLLYKYKDSTRM
jgi:hypothetical protein